MTSTFSNPSYIRRRTKPALIFMLILILTYLFSESVGLVAAAADAKDLKLGRSMVWPDGRKMMLGSRPPSCSGKCSTCRPCRASLVVPPTRVDAVGGDESYYLLSWKCRCGSRYFLP